MAVSEQPRGRTHALNVMAIGDVSKQRTLLVDVDVAPRGLDHLTRKCFASKIELQQEC